MVEITAGRYRMRNGQEAVVLKAIFAPNYTVCGRIGDEDVVWTTRGTWRNDGKPHPCDLIERIAPMPDRAVKAWAGKMLGCALNEWFLGATQGECRGRVEKFYGMKWRTLYRRGWRVVPVIVREGRE